ncbi:hypothetical protein C0991_008992 [Blastosporella zonata]|nr:hypothetical protein C0991_008992 [Blastosporella zonata]
MVFGLFSRKRASTTESQSEAVPAQLRTPSPSVVDKQNSPVREPPTTPSPPPEPLQPADLRARIQSIPAQIFHSYTLSRLHTSDSVDPETLVHLATFFSELAPPPQLHCVRCHKSYFDIENTDRSCLVAHDDESAVVERVSSKAKGKGTLYETLWGCCAKTVEGDGDMGPPDGWCYEGKHTTDLKRARFRTDSTMQDDKLTSCERMRCGMPPRSSRAARKRGRPVADEGEDDEGEQSSVSSSHPSTTSPRSSNGGRKKQRTRAPLTAIEPKPDVQPEPESTQMDVDTPAALTPPSPKPKPKSRAKSKAAASKSTSTPKTLFGSCFCPFVQRVWVSFEFLGIPYKVPVGSEYEVDPYKKPQDLLEISPKGLVPGLKLHNFSPPRALNENARALVRLQSDHINRNLVPSFYRFLQAQEVSAQIEGGKELHAAIEGLIALFERTESEILGGTGVSGGGELTALKRGLGLWVDGGDLGWVDVMAGPWIFRATNVLKHYRGFALPSGPKTEAYVKRLFAHPAFKATCSTEELYIDSYER